MIDNRKIKMHKKQQSLMDSLPPTGIEKLDRLAEGYQLYQTLMAALDLGLFDLLEKRGPLDRKKIAQEIGINGMFSRCFLNTLVDIEVISLKDEKYANTNLATDFLINSNLFYQGDRIRNIAQGNHWNNLVGSLKRQQQEIDNFKSGPSESFLNSLAQGALRGELQEVTKAVSNWEAFSKAKSLLDVGGGHGLYAIALCQANPHLNGVIFDKSHVINITQRYIERYGMKKRLSTQGGDICTDDFGSGFDIVVISHVLYKFRKNLEPIFDKASKCLNRGGLLVTNHWFCGTGCTSEGSSIKELAKSFQSFGHPLCHVEDFQKLFETKGFKLTKMLNVPSTYGPSSLCLAIKESNGRKSSNQNGCDC